MHNEAPFAISVKRRSIVNPAYGIVHHFIDTDRARDAQPVSLTTGQNLHAWGLCLRVDTSFLKSGHYKPTVNTTCELLASAKLP